ncbi:MAG: hypothetical protein NUV46_02780 [Nanoarchaeota archaeon]|nr:hypothetical protein [Nanoarchaeota archaeon]
MDVERCLHQVSSPGVTLPKYFLDMIGIGNCSICTYDPIENPKCLGYSPVKVFYFKSSNKIFSKNKVKKDNIEIEKIVLNFD